MFWCSPYFILGLKIFGLLIVYILTSLLLLLLATAVDTWCTARWEDRGFDLLYILGHILVGVIFLYTLPMFIILDVSSKPLNVALSDEEDFFH